MSGESYSNISLSGFQINRFTQTITFNSVSNSITLYKSPIAIYSKIIYASPLYTLQNPIVYNENDFVYFHNSLFYNNDQYYYPQNSIVHLQYQGEEEHELKLETNTFYFLYKNVKSKSSKNMVCTSIQFKPDEHTSLAIAYETISSSEYESFVENKFCFAWEIGEEKRIVYGENPIIQENENTTMIVYYYTIIPYSDVYLYTKSIDLKTLKIHNLVIKGVSPKFASNNSCFIFAQNTNKYLIGIIDE